MSAAAGRRTVLPPALRRALFWIVVPLAVAALLALVTRGSGRSERPDDPANPEHDGTMALARVLDDRGVDVQVVGSLADLERADTAGVTVLVGDPSDLAPGNVGRVLSASRGADHLVVVGPSSRQIEALGVPVSTRTTSSVGRLEAGCESPLVRPGDALTASTALYRARPGAEGVRVCFPQPGSAADAPAGSTGPAGALVTVPAADGRPETTILGAREILRNGQIRESAHAGVAVRALGRDDRLVWYLSAPEDLFVAGQETPSVVPAWFGPAMLLLASAVVVLGIARGRRLGPVVTEPLPVVVRASETTTSRARLYRRSRDRARMTAILRTATTTRLRSALAADPGAPVEALLEPAAALSGLEPRVVHDRLLGPVPDSDPALARLATDLSDLEKRVRHR